MDTLIGELLSSMSQETLANTYIIFLGDNDTVIDSVSMTQYLLDTNAASPRDWVLTEITFGLVPSRAIRNDRYKLIWRNDEQEFYDLDSDPHELNALDLSSLSGIEQDNYTELSVTVEQLLRRSL